MTRRRLVDVVEEAGVRPGRLKIGPRDGSTWAGIREAARRGHVSRAVLTDYDEMCRREALPPALRALEWARRHPALLGASLAVLGGLWLAGELVAELGPTRAGELFASALLLAGGVMVSRRRRPRRRRRSR